MATEILTTVEHLIPSLVIMSTDDLINKVQESWEGLGRSEPFWSVLTGEEFKSDKITHHARQVFFDSGEAEIDVIRGLLRRADLALPVGKCLDYGCGAGRVTIHLAGVFDSVLGADISRPHLAIAADYASARAVNNVVFLHVGGGANQLQDFLGQFAFIYSVIVLQHSPPARHYRNHSCFRAPACSGRSGSVPSSYLS